MAAKVVPVGVSTEVEKVAASTEVDEVGAGYGTDAKMVSGSTEAVRFPDSGDSRMEFVSGDGFVALAPDGYTMTVTSPLILDSPTFGFLGINTLS